MELGKGFGGCPEGRYKFEFGWDVMILEGFGQWKKKYGC